ncbi:aldehyde dehydrogenase family protein [Amycolatopsis echigonensis]|uniref:aldehyde dehydrogenase family protein n=1 Tax=Amycolatopsis echigonensis TaxID=2576905 RepID=UPI002484426E|nr:aldehyde dehydrogenase family protein [Amycolatopsis echigonensis]
MADGYFVQPTVFARATNAMRIAREEIFGPVATLIPFEDEDEAVDIANDTDYGLTAGLWTRDLSRAHRVAGRIEAGSVWVNTYSFVRWSMPYGGFKASGWGRENGIDALAPYLETRTTVIGLNGTFPDPYSA